MSVYEEVIKREFVEKFFPDRIYESFIDPTRVALGGHGFGGLAAISLGIKLGKDKICATYAYDPWFFPMRDEIEKGDFKMSNESPRLMMINTEHYAKQLTRRYSLDVYDHAKTFRQFHDNSEAIVDMRIESWQIKGATHCMPTDKMLLLPYELSHFENNAAPDKLFPLLYICNPDLTLEYLARINVLENELPSVWNSVRYRKRRIKECIQIVGILTYDGKNCHRDR